MSYKVLHQGHDEHWLELRRSSGIGASEAAAVAGLDRWASPLTVYGRKLGLIPANGDTVATEVGAAMERELVRIWAKHAGRAAQPSAELAQSEAHPYLLASPDAFTTTPDGRDCGLEIKVTSAVEAWKAGEVPVRVFYQAQQSMLVYGLEVWTVAALLLPGYQFVQADIERSAEWAAGYLPRAAEFWRRVLSMEGIPAEWLDGSDATAAALAALYPATVKADAELVATALPEEAALLLAEREQCAEAIKALEADKKRAENQLKALLGAADFGRLPDGTVLSYKAATRAAYTVEASTSRSLRVVKALPEGVQVK